MRAPSPDHCAVLVTGAAQRLGRAIAADLAADGWPVVVHYRGSEAEATALRDEIVRRGGSAALLQADLSDAAAVSQVIARASALLGPIGVLINNAAAFEFDALASADEQSWSANMDLNLRAPLLLSRDFAAQLPADHGGLVINMLDARVLSPTARYLTYTLSKTGLATLTRTLARALAPQVRVNGIAPGPTLPPPGQTGEEFDARCERLPLKRPAPLEEICATVHFLIRMRSITGQIIPPDGGDHLVRQAEAV